MERKGMDSGECDCMVCEPNETIGNKSASVTGLDSFAQAITYILCEIEANPEDSLKDIANEALINCNISLACNDDLSVEPHEWEAV